MVLQLKALGIQNVLSFPFVDPPPRAAVLRAHELLLALGALDRSGRLTAGVGSRMAELPVEPMYAKCLVSAEGMGTGIKGRSVI